MKQRNFVSFLALAGGLLFTSCGAFTTEDVPPEDGSVSLGEVAMMLSSLPLSEENLSEVHAAVTSSRANGYDEEYMMRNLFLHPGSGVGEKIDATRSDISAYDDALREKIGDEYMKILSSSDVQIYWPYSESWDGSTFPIITFDPGNEAKTNIGYEIVASEDGQTSFGSLIVDEVTARNRPVWVINRNSDSSFTTLEALRRSIDPDWKEGGSAVVVKSASDDGGRALVLKDFTMTRQYDSWFAGGSEFFVKCGSVKDFRASTEAELKLYVPSVTDFLVVVKRSQMGEKIPFNAILASSLTPQVEELAFMITEDDGGSQTSWKCDATVKVNSKAYGITLDLPFRTQDDIVWRGTLATSFIDKYIGKTQHFGDVDLTFDYLD